MYKSKASYHIAMAEKRDNINVITVQRTDITDRGQNQPAQNDDSTRNNNVALDMGIDKNGDWRKAQKAEIYPDDDTRKKDAFNLGGAIISENKSGDWRKTLSGAIDEERLIFALVALLIFYIGYATGNTFHDNNAKDVYIITRNCSCKPNHGFFYGLWFIIGIILWIIFHLFVEICGSRAHSFKGCFKGFCCLLSCCTQFLQCKCKNTYDIQLINDKKCRDQCCIACKQLCCSKIKSCIFDNDDIHRYENYLWTQYYELYVIGITKDIKMFSDKSVTNIFTEHLKNNDKDKNKDNNEDELDSPGKKSEDKSQENSRDPENKISAHVDIIACPLNYNIRGCGDQCMFLTHICIHFVLWFIRFLAQLALVPLLMIQMLDTYAFLCINTVFKSYCTGGEEYDLHLDQTAISFGFYCSLMLSYVTSIMLRWIPKPKSHSEKSLILELEPLNYYNIQSAKHTIV